MENMSYCRFENTFKALCECVDAMDQAQDFDDLIKEMSGYEIDALFSLIHKAERVTELAALLEINEELEFEILQNIE